MAISDNKKTIAVWEDLKKRINKAAKKRDFEEMIALSHEAIRLGNKEKSLNIKVFLFYKDIGEIYFKTKDYKQALENFRIAREGLLEYRATQKLKFPEDWLAELANIDRFIEKIDKVYFE